MYARFITLIQALARFVPLAGSLFLGTLVLTDGGRETLASLWSALWASSGAGPLLLLAALVVADLIWRRLRNRRRTEWAGTERRRNGSGVRPYG